MKDFKVLKLLDKISFLYEALGVDYELLRKILRVKLIMDGRRVPSVLSGNNTKEREGFRNTLLAYGFMGLFIMLFMLIKLPIFMKMNFILGMITFMIMATMVSDFSTVLLDLNDKNILLPRPIDLKTINAAKLTHICIYLFTITFVIAGPSFVVCGIKYGALAAVIFFLELFFIAGFVIFFTAILYFIVLIFFDGEKVKDIINYFQIFLSIIMLISYQFIGRIFEVSKFNIEVKPSWWHYFLPSAWFAAPYSYFLEGKHEAYYLLLSILGIIIPVIVLFIYIKYVTGYFEKNLQRLNENNEKKKNKVNKGKGYSLMSRIFCRDRFEASFFRFTYIMIGNERKLKLKIYPSLAYGIVFPFVFLLGMFRDYHSIGAVIKEVNKGSYYISIYAALAMLVPSLWIISRSENYSGAYIYRVLPLETPAPILKGAYKAFMVKCIIPVELFISLLFLALCGLKILPQIILIFLNMILLSIIMIYSSEKQLPFSRDFQLTTENNTGLMFGIMVICGVLAGVHALLGSNVVWVGLSIGIVIILIYVFWRKTFRLGWGDIKG